MKIPGFHNLCKLQNYQDFLSFNGNVNGDMNHGNINVKN